MTDDRRLAETLDDAPAFEAALSSFVAGPLADGTAARILDGARRRAAAPRTVLTRLRAWFELLAASPRLVPALALSLLLANLGLDASTNRFTPPTRPLAPDTATAAFTSSDLGLSSAWLDARTRLSHAARQAGAEGLRRPDITATIIND